MGFDTEWLSLYYCS